MHQIRTSAFIAAPPAIVWQVLTDFAAYPQWNPLNLSAVGEARLGARVAMTFRNPARAGAIVAQTVTITAFEPERRLEWVGRVPLLFRGRHVFTLEPEPGGTRLVHGEDLSGLMPWSLGAARIARDFTPGYEALNAALAKRASAMV